MGTIVEGKVEQGTIRVGDKLCVMPNRVTVEALQRSAVDFFFPARGGCATPVSCC